MIKVKMFTREVGRLEKEIYLTPSKLANGKPVVAGNIIASNTDVDGKRILTLELDERNSKRFSGILLTEANADEYVVSEWIENHFDVWNHRRLQLRVRNR